MREKRWEREEEGEKEEMHLLLSRSRRMERISWRGDVGSICEMRGSEAEDVKCLLEKSSGAADRPHGGPEGILPLSLRPRGPKTRKQSDSRRTLRASLPGSQRGQGGELGVEGEAKIPYGSATRHAAKCHAGISPQSRVRLLTKKVGEVGTRHLGRAAPGTWPKRKQKTQKGRSEAPKLQVNVSSFTGSFQELWPASA